jgi:hypothetical protein
MTASERIRRAREARRTRKSGAKLDKYGPAYCDCLRCRIIRYTTD